MQEIIRHLISSIVFRHKKATEKADENFANMQLGYGVRSPVEILYHMRAVAIYAQYLLTNVKKPIDPQSNWSHENRLFIAELKELDEIFSRGSYSTALLERITQGPLADILTHIGQLAMLSRVNGHPVHKLNYSKATISMGKFDVPD